MSIINNTEPLECIGRVVLVGIAGHGSHASCLLQFTVENRATGKPESFQAGPWSESGWDSYKDTSHLPQVFAAIANFITAAYFLEPKPLISVLYHPVKTVNLVHQVSSVWENRQLGNILPCGETLGDIDG